MKTYKTVFGEQKEVKVSNKDLAQDLLDARGEIIKIWLENKPTTDEEQAVWTRLGIALEQVYESANLLRKQ